MLFKKIGHVILSNSGILFQPASVQFVVLSKLTLSRRKRKLTTTSYACVAEQAQLVIFFASSLMLASYSSPVQTCFVTKLEFCGMACASLEVIISNCLCPPFQDLTHECWCCVKLQTVSMIQFESYPEDVVHV